MATGTGQTTNDFSPPRKKWLTVLGLASLRGRYLYVAILFVLILMGAAGLGEWNVRHATEHALGNTGTRNDIRRSLRELTEDVWAMESALHDFMLAPNDAAKKRLHQHLTQAYRHANQMLVYDWARDSEQLSRQVLQVRSNLEELSRHSKRAMDIRVDAQRLFPAMPVMLTQMLPAYTDFNTAATQAMDEVVEDLQQPAQIESYRVFSEARYSMTQLVGSFRLWVANRFGIFGDAT